MRPRRPAGAQAAGPVGIEALVDGRHLSQDRVLVPGGQTALPVQPRRHAAQHPNRQTAGAGDEDPLRRLGREQQPDQHRHHDPGQNRGEAVDAQRDDVVRVAGVEQRDHRRRIAGKDRSVGDEAPQDVAQTGAQPDPQGQPDDDHNRLVVRQRDQQHPDHHPDQGAEPAEQAFFQQRAAHRLGRRPHRHRRPLRVLQPQQPRHHQRQTGGQRRAQGKDQPRRIETPSRRPMRRHSPHRHSDRLPLPVLMSG